jgi:hypothetical protein
MQRSVSRRIGHNTTANRVPLLQERKAAIAAVDRVLEHAGVVENHNEANVPAHQQRTRFRARLVLRSQPGLQWVCIRGADLLAQDVESHASGDVAFDSTPQRPLNQCAEAMQSPRQHRPDRILPTHRGSPLSAACLFVAA